jgi:hypothetical protein
MRCLLHLIFFNFAIRFTENIMKYLIILLLLISMLAFSCKKDGAAPVITLKGKSPVQTGKGYPYSDAGATALDEEDGDISDKIVVTSNVDTGTLGTYLVRYNVKDSDGNQAEEVTREVIVKYF